MTAPSHPVPGRVPGPVPGRVPGRVPGGTDGALRTAVVTSSVGVLAVAVLRLALARSWVGAGELAPWAAALLVAGAACLVVSPSRTAVLAARGLAAAGALAALVTASHGVGLAAGLALLATVGHPACERAGSPVPLRPPAPDDVTTTRELPSVRVTQEIPAVPAGVRS